MPVTMLALLVLSAEPHWSTTFDPAAAASYLDRPNAAVIVVAAGAAPTVAPAAAAALAQALKDSRQTRLVMTGESLSVAPADDDAAIVKRAAVLPVDLVVIVRTFGGTVETAVATIYDKQGSAVSGMAGVLGQPLPRKEAHLASTAARDAVRSTVGNARNSAEVDLDDEHITYRRMSPDTPLYKGRTLDGPRFYEVVKKPELATGYRVRTTVKALSIITGSGLLATGTLVFLFGPRFPTCAVVNVMTATCQMERPGITAIAGGLIIAGVGLATLVFGIAFPSDPVDADRRRELVKAHNQRLDDPTPAPTAEPVKLNLTFTAIPGGAFGGVSGTF